MTVQQDGFREIEKLVRVHSTQSISDDEFCENVILRMVHADQSDWRGMLNAASSVGTAKLQAYCERIDIAIVMPLYEALMLSNLPPETEYKRREYLRSIYRRLSDEILDGNRDAR